MFCIAAKIKPAQLPVPVLLYRRAGVHKKGQERADPVLWAWDPRLDSCHARMVIECCEKKNEQRRTLHWNHVLMLYCLSEKVSQKQPTEEGTTEWQAILFAAGPQKKLYHLKSCVVALACCWGDVVIFVAVTFRIGLCLCVEGTNGRQQVVKE